MNEEEKRTIEDMNRFANGIDMSCVTARQMQIILNLIEKLQKEKEELIEIYRSEKKMKNEYIKFYQDLLLKENVIPVQKVKDKIEELNKKEKEELKGMKGQDRYFVKQTYQNKRMILQELIKESED